MGTTEPASPAIPASRRRLPHVPATALRLGALLLALALGCDGSSPTAPRESVTCGPWPSQERSPYVLPYPAGHAYFVSQGNCTARTHAAGTRDGYAYDFAMPIGSSVVAARDGVVGELEERFEDGNGVLSEANYVLLRHDDGDASVYFHLTRDGVLVSLGQAVRQGEPIALSGQTGRAGIGPHLHFGVLGRSGFTLPITFSNTVAHPNGLQEGETYPAF